MLITVRMHFNEVVTYSFLHSPHHTFTESFKHCFTNKKKSVNITMPNEGLIPSLQRKFWDGVGTAGVSNNGAFHSLWPNLRETKPEPIAMGFGAQS